MLPGERNRERGEGNREGEGGKEANLILTILALWRFWQLGPSVS